MLYGQMCKKWLSTWRNGVVLPASDRLAFVSERRIFSTYCFSTSSLIKLTPRATVLYKWSVACRCVHERKRNIRGRLDCDNPWRPATTLLPPDVALRRQAFPLPARAKCIVGSRMNGTSRFIDEWSDNSITTTSVMSDEGHRVNDGD